MWIHKGFTEPDSLTPWTRILCKKLINKFPAFNRTKRIINVFIRACPCTLFYTTVVNKNFQEWVLFPYTKINSTKYSMTCCKKQFFLPSCLLMIYADHTTSTNQHTASGQLVRLHTNVHQPFTVIQMITKNN